MNPFLRWAGGKRWLVSHITPMFIIDGGTYYEPFLGSASIFFSFLPTKSILTDTNIWLVETYQAIKDDYLQVLSHLQIHHINHSKEYYYKVRNETATGRFENAARLIYLNRTCWNALFRVNRYGVYNVPVGSKTSVLLPTDRFEDWSQALQNTEVIACDFSTSIAMAGEGDLIYADPPYVTSHNKNGFVKYNEKIFTWNDQERLADASFRAAARGAKIIISNANHDAIKNLYDKPNAEFSVVKRSSILAADNQNRNSVEELVVFIVPR